MMAKLSLTLSLAIFLSSSPARTTTAPRVGRRNAAAGLAENWLPENSDFFWAPAAGDAATRDDAMNARTAAAMVKTLI